MISRSPNITWLLDKSIAKKLARLNRVVDEAFQKFPRMTKAGMQTLLELLDRIQEHLAVKTAKGLSLEKAELQNS